MFSQVRMPSTSSVFSAYTTFVASAMLVKTMLHEVQTLAKQLVPQQLQDKILSGIGRLLGDPSSQMTLVIDEYNGYTMNQIFEASQIYLPTKISPAVSRLRVSRSPREKNLLVTINKGEKVIDVFEGIQLKWEMVSITEKQLPMGIDKPERRSLELSFLKKNMEKVLSSYLPYVVERSESIKEENKVVKLYSLGNPHGGAVGGGAWGSINLDHPSTFETLAMDLKLKEDLIKDLDRFVRRRKFYKRVGKTWKRGYLLYGPPGTGKTSLIAAMANYLKFDIYDLELTTLQRNSQFRNLLASTKNRSIIVIEDIDCSTTLQDRQAGRNNQTTTQLTLSGLLNFIDGLWSSCGDERIIVLTTNHKDRIDPALLRPGRMDMHIHMSYCTPYGFKTLASNYLGVSNHRLFTEIERLITEVEVTPAEIAEELMKSEEADVALEGLIEFLKRARIAENKSNGEGKEVDEQGTERRDVVESEKVVETKRQKIANGELEISDFMPCAYSFSVEENQSCLL
ncbi:AAA-ATPase At3g50940-like [Vitis riparia]|uniref:AAA-ATPase At3g50940-like n=1 Tax=Vitis riparia TaxID=96939 RepID=UPI00155AD295|nr:AAA-ATPase At3g50940-like [Vitis riparia]XP_034699098.1 AAA-ATPase At3g50940-like [Vitis riparia]